MTLPSMDMHGKVVLITGGRIGLGKAFALAFAEAGADVAICSRGEIGDEIREVTSEVEKLGRHALALKADVSRKSDVENLVNAVVEKYGTIDVLINNAGINIFKPFLETSEDMWDSVIDTDLKGTFFCSQAAARVMVKKERGNIINLSSLAGLKARSPRAAYCIAKAGVIMLTRVLALELGPYSIRVNSIAPGGVRTPMAEPFLLKYPAAVKEMIKNTPLGRLGEAEDITGAALFLASDAASWITGHTILIDGGFLA